MNDPKDHLAETLRDTRKSLKLSLDKAAEKTGVSKAMLGQIERGESSPTVSTLWKIATGLGVSLSSFIEPSTPLKEKTLIRTSADIQQNPAQGGMLIAPLYPYDKQLGFEYFELTFEKDYERMSEPHAAGVVEFLTVMEGEMEVFSEGQWHKVAKGQSIRFAGDQDHGYRNQSNADCLVLTVIHYKHQTQGTS